MQMHNEVSEDEIDQKLQTLNNLKEQQKQLFFIIIKKFIHIITEHLNTQDIKTEEGEKPVLIGPHWLKWIGERFEDFLLTVKF